ncbi:chromosomal replication initiator protein DnaA [Holosporaceae bacterium 'Namur']|nr:chromosomal replication initiator protein DnaA [Holosporaceae bacterium 'Namur']
MQCTNLQERLPASIAADHEELWVSVLENLKDEYGLATFNSWFTHLSFQEIKDGTLKITAPSKFIRECVINNYFRKIKQLVSELDPNIKIIDLRVKQNRPSLVTKEKKPSLNDNSVIRVEEYESSTLASNLDRKLTFDNFVVGNSNKLAFMASKAVAEGKSNNPTNVLYIHGAVGMGKTHLLQAIAEYIGNNQPNRNVAYLSAEKFMHQYILSLKNNSSLGFREHLRSLDILLIDDIQFICGKSSTQQEFANTFNALVESGRMVVISCDRSPYQLELDGRTKSRLAGGLSVEIKPADFALRYEILKTKANMLNLNLSKDILEFIAQSVTSSIRELEGALNNLSLYVNNFGMELNLRNTKEILKDCILAHEVSVTVDKIIEVVANFYGVTAKEIFSKSRESKYVLPRQVSAFISKQLTDKSLKDIGQALGKRDHATVIYSIKKLEERMANDKSVNEDITKIIDMIGAR